MVSSDEIKRRLEAKRRGVDFREENNMNTAAKNKSKSCPDCGTGNFENAKFCVGCGKKFYETSVQIKPEEIKENHNTKMCPACKSEIPEKAKFCVVCGETMVNTKSGITTPVKEESAPLGESNAKIIEKDAIKSFNPPTNEDTVKSTETDAQKPVKLIIEELVITEDGLELNKNGITENLNNGTQLLKYENIENIEFKEGSEFGIIEISGPDANIKIKGIDINLGNQFTSAAKERIMQTKLKAEKDAESMDKIKKAKELLDMGAITEEEFEKIKRKIMEDI